MHREAAATACKHVPVSSPMLYALFTSTLILELSGLSSHATTAANLAQFGIHVCWHSIAIPTQLKRTACRQSLMQMKLLPTLNSQ
jgi:hypothetical protein